MVLGILSHTMWYYWVQGVLGTRGTRGVVGYCKVPLGSVKYCWVLLGYWVVLRGNGGVGHGNRGYWGLLLGTAGCYWELGGTVG